MPSAYDLRALLNGNGVANGAERDASGRHELRHQALRFAALHGGQIFASAPARLGFRSWCGTQTPLKTTGLQLLGHGADYSG